MPAESKGQPNTYDDERFCVGEIQRILCHQGVAFILLVVKASLECADSALPLQPEDSRAFRRIIVALGRALEVANVR